LDLNSNLWTVPIGENFQTKDKLFSKSGEFE